MENILEQPFTIEKCEEFNEYCRANNKHIEQVGDKRYALAYNEIVVNGEIVVDEDYEEKQRQAERERLNALELTRGDVFIGLIQARMINEQMLKAQIEAEMPETTDEEKVRKMLAINALENALHFHRGHDLVNEIGSELGISEENLDNFFETGDYHYLLPEPEPEVVDEEETSQDEPEPEE